MAGLLKPADGASAVRALSCIPTASADPTTPTTHRASAATVSSLAVDSGVDAVYAAMGFAFGGRHLASHALGSIRRGRMKGQSNRDPGLDTEMDSPYSLSYWEAVRNQYAAVRERPQGTGRRRSTMHEMPKGGAVHPISRKPGALRNLALLENPLARPSGPGLIPTANRNVRRYRQGDAIVRRWWATWR